MSNELPFAERPFELLREIVPRSPLTSKIILRADKAHPGVPSDHLDRIELGEFGGVHFELGKDFKERFDH